MSQIIITELSELKKALKEVLIEVNLQLENERIKALNTDKLYTINEVRKRLGKAHNTIKKLVKAGYIKTTKDGLISEDAINEYLQK